MSNIYLTLTDRDPEYLEIKEKLADKLIRFNDTQFYCDEQDFLKFFNHQDFACKIDGLTRPLDIGIENTKKLLDDCNSRFYFEVFGNKEDLLDLKNDPKIGYDLTQKLYYVNKEDLASLELRRKLVKTINLPRRAFLASDLNHGKITQGLTLLADALNNKNFSESLLQEAEALYVCLYEKRRNIEGSLQTARELNQNPLLLTRFCNFVNDFEYCEKHDLDDPSSHAVFLQHAARQVKQMSARSLSRIDFEEGKRQALTFVGKDLLSYLEALSAEIKSIYLKGENLPYDFKEKNDPFLLVKDFPVSFLEDPDLQELLNKAEKCYENELTAFRKASCFEDLQNLHETGIAVLIKTVKDDHNLNLNPYLRNTALPFPTPKSTVYPFFLAEMTKAKRSELPDHLKKLVNYDFVNRAWYIPSTAENIKNFRDFMPKTAEPADFSLSAATAETTIREKLEATGLLSFECMRRLKIDGRWHHDPGNGFNHMRYVVNLTGDHPCAMIIDSKRNENIRVSLQEHLRLESKELYWKSKVKEENQRLVELNQKYSMSEALAAEISSLKPCTKQCGYAVRKKIDGRQLGGFSDETGSFSKWFAPNLKDTQKRDALFMPIYTPSGMLASMQMLCADGSKYFCPNAPLKGNFTVAGGYESLKDAKKIILCEGIATGASIKECIPDAAVVCCLSCGNMSDVALGLSKYFPESVLAICPDLDVLNACKPELINGHENGNYMPNSGINGAVTTIAQNYLNCGEIPICMPPLHREHLEKHYSDFNDAMILDPMATKERLTSFNASLEKIVKAKQSSLSHLYDQKQEETLLKQQKLKAEKICNYKKRSY